jgi:hypothetical protein
MASRIFDQFDIINQVNIGTLPSGNIVASDNFSVFGNFHLSADTGPSQATLTGINLSGNTYGQTGDIDFSLFPSIPETSVISRVRIKSPFNANIQLSCSGLGAFYFTKALTISVYASNGISQFPLYSHSESHNDDTPINIIEVFAGSTAICLDQTFDPPISYAEFVATYGHVELHFASGQISVERGFVTQTQFALISLSYNGNWEMEVDYEVTSSLTFNLAVPEEPVEEGDTVTVTSNGDLPLDLEAIETITLVYPDGTEVEVLAWTVIGGVLTFIMSALPGDPIAITIMITSTQFSGSVTLGSLITIFFTDAGGLYRIVPDKRTDTIYVNDEPGDTLEIAFPAPFADTGIING